MISAQVGWVAFWVSHRRTRPILVPVPTQIEQPTRWRVLGPCVPTGWLCWTLNAEDCIVFPQFNSGAMLDPGSDSPIVKRCPHQIVPSHTQLGFNPQSRTDGDARLNYLELTPHRTTRRLSAQIRLLVYLAT